ncbi:hypothetical protein GCM10023205_54210 [Yinghuangia aomiensis]|uniref:Terminal beta-(1->2)-arabinofuranosyltransferase C-terminal domain-containing protein n=1 Tax=Yinghuangia aomiensis TaxID=676205 RepID=A0ABP9HVC3_9ACTN
MHQTPRITNDPQVNQEAVVAARNALSCGRLKELQDSVEKPVTLRRFWKNLTGAVSRTNLRIPDDPFEAEREFCGS